MTVGCNSAVLDNDFINHIAEARMPSDRVVELFALLFSDMQREAVVHPLVYDKEVPQNNTLINRLFNEDVINRATFEDVFLPSGERKSYYLFLLEELYYAFYGHSFPAKGDEMLTYWRRKQSLGEIHSIAMCLVCKCGIFLSDDGDSKKLRDLVRIKAHGQIEVYDRKEWITYHQENGGTTIKRQERQSLTHVR